MGEVQIMAGPTQSILSIMGTRLLLGTNTAVAHAFQDGTHISEASMTHSRSDLGHKVSEIQGRGDFGWNLDTIPSHLSTNVQPLPEIVDAGTHT
jgi:hypothetical protein